MNDHDQKTSDGWVPILADAALHRLIMERLAVSSRRTSGPGEMAARAERLAVLCERESAWMGVLARWVWRRYGEVPVVLARAAFEAGELRHQQAQFWRNSAADWRQREAGQPVCSVIGCGCGGICEVSA
jgi:hypothetical protein